jgi:4-amino-4-deoxy-L-arabinose transferase-like glycosyltransferase
VSKTRARTPRKQAPPARRTRSSASSRTHDALAATRSVLARVPRAAWLCALVALLNAVCWSLITPPFLALDEPDHFAYVQQLVETGRLPSSPESEYSQEEQVALSDLHHAEVRFRPANHTIFSTAQQDKLESDLAQPLSRAGPGGAGVASSEPPLYYALQAIPYVLGSGGSILTQLTLMRLLSALLAGVTGLFVFLFLREALPEQRWAWTVGGLGVAFGPLLGYSSSSVNPDALLIAVSAVVFYCLARAFRHGLTQRSALVLGALIATGIVTKLNFAGLVPGVVLGLILLARREARIAGASAYYRMLAPALAVAISPGVLYGAVNVLSHHSLFGLVSGGTSSLTSARRSISAELGYIWQFYLPRLPWMHNDFSGISIPRQVWFRDVIGLYGWGDTTFPGWVYSVAAIPVVAIGVLCMRELARAWPLPRARAAELATYALMTLGLLTLIGASSYLVYPSAAAEFTDARYLLPLAGLWGAVLALASRGAGRRWGPAVGAAILVLVIANDLFGQLQVIARYYG